MKITLTKVSSQKHIFEVEREGGSLEKVELETRSFLLHDLIHFTIESEAKLRHGFYGSLAKGVSFADIRSESFMDIEEVVGPFTGVAKGEATPTEFMSGIKNLFGAQEKELPVWLDEAFAKKAKEKVDVLKAQWERTAFGESMELIFEI